MKEIGIYIHIPFCKGKCNYCDFTSFANKDKSIEKYIKCVKKEIQNKASNKKYLVKTIFIGGGTPSYISEKYIGEILETLKSNFDVSKNAEITIEVNPGTVDKNKLEKYYEYGINRISIGLQTSNDQILKLIGRIHTFEQYEQTINIAREVGFTNINSDIIIGLPTQTIYDVEDTINKLIELELTHISVYSLIVEDGTKIEKMLSNNEITLPDEEIERYMYWFAKRKLEQNGFIHYEISNFSKPGFQSQHNLDCWKQKEYLGFGTAAASYENKTRYANTSCLEDYILNIEKDEGFKNIKIEEKQSKQSEMNEYVILGLRKLEGINTVAFKKKFGKDLFEEYKEQFNQLIQEELLVFDVNYIKLSKKGLDLANIVWREFM